jgi:hypothetical protein
MEFIPRDYQKPLINAFFSGKYKRFISIWHRRAGKDLCSFNLMVMAAIETPGVYFYCLPSYSQCRKVVWNGMTNDGVKFLDFIDPKWIASKNEQQMIIRFHNNSYIQLIGADNADSSLVGTNVRGIVFSEFALSPHYERASQLIRPILVANDGWAHYISTPRGKQNQLYDMYQIAQDFPEDWFSELLTIEDTGIISKEAVQKEVNDRVMSSVLAKQEYYCTFLETEGSFYGEYIDRLRVNDQITNVPWEPSHPVMTGWDLGFDDHTCIIWAQYIGGTLRIIDSYSSNKKGLDSHIHHVLQKPYTYSHHIAPFDINVHEYSSGITRKTLAMQMGINFMVAPSPAEVRLADGIEAVRATLPKTYFNESTTKDLVKDLEGYHRKQDRHGNPLMVPEHKNSHFPDAFRYLCISLPKARPGMTEQDAQRLLHEAHGTHYNKDWPF